MTLCRHLCRPCTKILLGYQLSSR